MDGRAAAAGGYLGADGYSSWPTADTTGYGSYTYDYGQDPTATYAYASKAWDTSYPTATTDGATHTGLIPEGQEGHYGAVRYDSYNLTDQVTYKYSEPDAGYGSRREQRQQYPPQRVWGAGPRGGFRGHFGAPSGGRGAGRPPPLLNPGPFPELGGYQGLRAFTGNSYFGGGFKQRTKRSWKERAAQRKLVKEGGPRDKKQRPSTSIEDTESESEGDGDAEGTGKGKKADANDKEEDEKETGNCEKGTEQKPSSIKKQQETQTRRQRDRMVERIQFICSLCKFRTFYEEEMSHHMDSEFHKEHFRFVGGKLPTQAADFLEEYVTHKTKKTEERRQLIEDLNATIHQIYRDQDLTRDLGMEHFVKKVEAAHCAACDIFVPMHFTILQRHLKSPIHNQKCRNMMEQSKKSALAVAQSILNNKLISQKLDRYIKGGNPFTDDPEETTECDRLPTETAPKGDKAEGTSDIRVAVTAVCPDQQDTPSLNAPMTTEEEEEALAISAPEESSSIQGKEESSSIQGKEESSSIQGKEELNEAEESNSTENCQLEKAPSP
ncbi:A-kinase anchor protein 8-like [Ascaphus truei]|uniref:A-kinase anchor protein 8-like n=1 Tax=Ascaphus truei TaxID=8439 RepID=UPI003F5A0C74